MKIMETRDELIRQCRESCDKRDMQGVVNALASLYVSWRKEREK